MLKFRTLMRRDLVKVRNIDVLTFKERFIYGMQYMMANTEGAIARREANKEKEFIKMMAKENRLATFFLREIHSNFHKRSDVKTFCIAVDKEFEDVIMKVLSRKDFKGFKITLGHIDADALKLLKNIRIPVIFEKDVI